MFKNPFNIDGLDDASVVIARKQFGVNKLQYKKNDNFIIFLKALAKEPMILLLILAAMIYFISGKTADAIFMMSAIILVSLISMFQQRRSKNALEKLKDLTQPACKVIRNGAIIEIPAEEIVVGDAMIAEESTSVVADGIILSANDFSVNESILTGESLPVYKDRNSKEPLVYCGTTVSSGLCIAKVTAIGNNTQLGKIGKSLESISEEKTPLEKQINAFIKKMVLAGTIVFFLVWIINYINVRNILDSLLKALTLAMSILPEEIPVAFTTFLALGAWRLMKSGVIVKQMKTVETLGSATVLCIDKTGTITENRMSLAKIYVLSTDQVSMHDESLNDEQKNLLKLAMWASEPIPIDQMELALHEKYSAFSQIDERLEYKMFHEYPLDGTPPMMTHVFQNQYGHRIIAAKGAPEAISKVCNLTDSELQKIEKALDQFAKEGYRILAVAEAHYTENIFPERQEFFSFEFKGLIAFFDPPKQNISDVLQDFYKAGIKVKIITGDNAITTQTLAKQIHFNGSETYLSGEQIKNMDEKVFREKVNETQIFSRMFPEAKLKVINELKTQDEIVAMTGDGVNDGPALKAAHIGIAMGKKGTEIAKQAASLILVDDDLAKIVDAIALGRKIYSNLKKAIQYIISIHIPIILTVLLPLSLGWVYPNIFTPVHVIFFELIMGPTCSVIYENEPMEDNTMLQKPRPLTVTFFNWHELLTSILQGLIISAGVLTVYQISVYTNCNEQITRALTFIALITSNIVLTLVNRSFYYSLLTTIKYKNNLLPLIIFMTILLSVILLTVNPLAVFFGFECPPIQLTLIAIGIGIISVIWFEIWKWRKRMIS